MSTSEPPGTPPSTGPSASPPTIKPGIKLGSMIITGPAALVVAVLLLALVIALIVWSKPSAGMLIAGGIWVGFLVFWSATAGQGARGTSGESAQSRAVRQNMLNLGLVLLFLSIPGLRWSFLPPNSWHVWVGLAIMAASTLLHIWARVHLGHNWASEVAIRRDHQLIRSGPYRFVRHPVYTALLGLAFGTALVSGRVVSLIGALVFTVAYIRKLGLEEQALGATFGAEWTEYRRRSWRLVPGVY